MNDADVLILLGSKSDKDAVSGCGRILDEFGVPYRQEISSAHRQPERTLGLVQEAEERGVKIIIAAAGMAAHLPGVVASHTTLPVIGVPMDGSSLSGKDALYSIVQMPKGVPVACVAIGSHGAQNAALLAIEILALNNESLREKLRTYRRGLAGEK
jgi:phosphoribosylaminoimidazole carboxylase PurE protein